MYFGCKKCGESQARDVEWHSEWAAVTDAEPAEADTQGANAHDVEGILNGGYSSRACERRR